MRHNYLVLMAIAFVLALAFAGCKKDTPGTLTPKITDENVTVTVNSATFTWTVDWVGKRISVVELSEHEDMSNSQFYGSEEELNKSEFIVTVNDLLLDTKYYYRFWVWNQNYVDNKFVMETKNFSTTEAINGLFSVSESKKVWFSKGNLQYIGSASTPYWKFADHQWTVYGNQYQGSTAPNVDRDLFGWGTSGYHNSGDSYNTNYQPYSTSTSKVNTSYNEYGYGPSTNQSNPNIEGTQYDWGVHNPIYNGGNWAGLWRTLTKDEWKFVFNDRSASTVNGTPDARFAKGKVNGVYGVILFPDNYSHPSGVTVPFGINDTGNTGWNYNNYSESDWALMEAKGCVFLPAAGYRYGTSVSCVGYFGIYWSASYNGSGNAYEVIFKDSYLSPQSSYPRYNGYSVRLVRDAQ